MEKHVINSHISNSAAYYEDKKHTDTMFAYNVYPCTIPLDFSFVPMHWQDSVEIIYIKEGQGIVQVDLELFYASGGDIFIVMPGHLHGIRSYAGHTMQYENIIFDLSFIEQHTIDVCSQKYWQPLLNEKLRLPVSISSDHILHPHLSSCLDASDHLCDQRPKGYELAVKGYLMIFFSWLFAYTGKASPDDRKHTQKLKEVFRYLEEHFNQKISVSQMAAHCGYSASHFMRWFKEMTGIGFYTYLLEYRLDKAAKELRSSTLTVLEIAQRNGFDNLSGFNRMFKKKFEMTPSQFRKQNTKQADS